MTASASQLPLLTLMLVVPAVGALAALAARGAAGLGVARLAAALTLGLSVLVVVGFDPVLAGPQLVDARAWLPGIGASWRLGVDGISLPFVPLTALLLVAVLGAVDARRVPAPGAFGAVVLLLGTALLGVYLSLDVVPFFAFWELGLGPSLLLLGAWGTGPTRRRTAVRGFVALLLGGIPLLLGLLLLAAQGGAWVTDLGALAARPPSLAVQGLALGLLLLGLAAKAPLPPLHGWMPEALGEGPPALGALVVGLKIGAWGMLRLAAPLCPDAWRIAAPWLAGLAVLGALYAALVALRQTTLRRLVAWLGISHVGVVVLGAASGDPAGLRGALLTLASFPLGASAVVLLAGHLVDRVGTEDLHRVGGLATAAPRLAGLLVAAGLASAGLPGTVGFAGELLALTGAARALPWTLPLALAALAVGAVAVVRAGDRILGGPPTPAAVRELRDLRPREAAPILLLVGTSFVLGLAPQPTLDATDADVVRWTEPAPPPAPPAPVERPAPP